MKRLFFLIMSLIVTNLLAVAQSKKWQRIMPLKASSSQTQSQFQELFQDKAYDLGSENLPSPRFGASSWQTGKGEWILFSGVGYDSDGHWGLLDDLWKYTASDNTWILLSGKRKVDTKKWAEATEVPISRRDAVNWIDNQGNLYLMGGRQLNDTEYFYDLWKYSVKVGTWSRVSSKTSANTNAVWGQSKGNSGANLNPGSRSGASSWTDKNGNLWLFGGSNMDNSKGKPDLYSDLWMYSSKKATWVWVSGSDKPNGKGKFSKKGSVSTEQSPAARTNAASWYDEQTDKLWLYGGNGIDSTGKDTGGLADLWSYDINKNAWQWVGGNTDLYASKSSDYQSSPGYRWAAATWKDQDGNFLLYGGKNKISTKEIDIDPMIWRFSPKTGRWSVLLVYGAPNVMSDAEAFTDAGGNLVLFGGRKLNAQTLRANPTNELWTIKEN